MQLPKSTAGFLQISNMKVSFINGGLEAKSKTSPSTAHWKFKRDMTLMSDIRMQRLLLLYFTIG